MKCLADDFFFLLVTFEKKIKKLGLGPKTVKIRKNIIFAGEADIKVIIFHSFKRPDGPDKLEPLRLLSRGREKDKGVTFFGQFAPDFQVAANPAENLDMGKKRRNLHFRLNVARVPLRVKSSHDFILEL
jgi:hypothetical protein